MLYDPKWEACSTERFAAWLSQQWRWRRYDYPNARNCLATRYLRSQGAISRDDYSRIEHLIKIGWWDIVAPHPWTYGAAADRARALI